MSKFIGMACVLLAAGAARADLTGPGQPLSLVGKPQVRKELALNEAAEATVNKALADLAKGTMTPQKALAAVTEKALSPEQVKRLEEISYQARGGAALMDEKVALALGLTKGQKSAMKKSWDAAEAKMQAFLMVARFRSAAARDAYVLESRRKAGEALLAFLTSGQKKRFQALHGKPFDWAALYRAS
jgi:hypothetical protein